MNGKNGRIAWIAWTYMFWIVLAGRAEGQERPEHETARAEGARGCSTRGEQGRHGGGEMPRSEGQRKRGRQIAKPERNTIAERGGKKKISGH